MVDSGDIKDTGQGTDLGFMEGGLTQCTILLGGGSQHVKHARTRGPGGMPPRKINAKLLQFKDIST